MCKFYDQNDDIYFDIWVYIIRIAADIYTGKK